MSVKRLFSICDLCFNGINISHQLIFQYRFEMFSFVNKLFCFLSVAGGGIKKSGKKLMCFTACRSNHQLMIWVHVFFSYFILLL